MGIFTCSAPPFPTFIKCEEASFAKGQAHMKRMGFLLCDLLYVKQGTLYITENQQAYAIEAGQYYLLAPELEHFGHRKCQEQTNYFWLHFQVNQEYLILSEGNIDWGKIIVEEGSCTTPPKYTLHLPQHAQIKQREVFEAMLQRLIEIDGFQAPEEKLRQQLVFEELLLFLQKEALSIPSSAEQVSQKVLDFIHSHYQQPIRMEDISHELLFHPDYITRCMQYTTGMTPTQYIAHYRMSMAKNLLSTSNEKMSSIAMQVGIGDSTYFSKLFKKIEGITPIEYRRTVGRRA